MKRLLMTILCLGFFSGCSQLQSTPAAGDPFSIQPRWEATAPRPTAMVRMPGPAQRRSFHSQTQIPTVDLEGKIREVGQNWWYGQGLGETLINVGTVSVFPPYALYVLGNAGLKYAGLNPLYLTNTLPEEPRKQVLSVYDSVTSVPGRVNATLAGENYRDPNQDQTRDPNKQERR